MAGSKSTGGIEELKKIQLSPRYLYVKIPDDWDLESIENICHVKGGKRLPKGDKFSLEKTNFPYVRVDDFEKNSVNLKNIKYIEKQTFEKIKNYTISKDDAFISIAGTIGIVGIVPEILDGCNLTENAAKLIITNKQKIFLNFIPLLFSMDYVRTQFLSYIGAVSVPKLALFRIKKCLVVLPPLSEQQKITSILSNVDDLISSYEKTIDTTKKLKKSLMQTLLTKGIGHKKFKKVKWYFGKEIEIPEEWNMQYLKELTKKIGDGIHTTPNYVEKSDYYFINGNNLVNGKIVFFTDTKNVSKEEYKKYKLNLDSNTVFLSINGTIGNIAFYNDEKIVLGKSACYLICNNNLDETYLFYLLQSNYLKVVFGRELTATTISNLSLGTIRNSLILVPDLKEQQKIASILSSIDEKISDLESKKKAAESLKKGLMQKLLTGEIRVKT